MTRLGAAKCTAFNGRLRDGVLDRYATDGGKQTIVTSEAKPEYMIFPGCMLLFCKVHVLLLAC